jgi:hypothetical protein
LDTAASPSDLVRKRQPAEEQELSPAEGRLGQELARSGAQRVEPAEQPLLSDQNPN